MTGAFRTGAAVRAALLMTGSTYITYGLGLLVSVLIARAIGPEDFGRYSYLVWLSGALVMIANNGLNTTGIRFISECLGRDSDVSARRVHAWLLRRQWLWMVGVAILFIAVMPYFRPAGWEGGLTLFATVVLVSMFAKGFYLFDISMAKGHGRFGIEAATTVLMSILNTLVVAVMFFTQMSLTAYLILFALISAGHMTSAAMMLRRAGLRPMPGELESEVKVRMKAHLIWTIVLTGVAVLGNRSIEIWLLNALVGPAEVGYFAIAAALTRGGVDMLSSGLTTVLMPVMAHAYGTAGQRGVNSILSDSVRYFQFLGFLLAGSGMLLAPVVVTAMYGPNYEPVIMILRVMVVVGGLALTEGAFGALLSTTDNQRLRAGFAVMAVSISAIAAIALIPKYGLFGAVIAHAVSRAIIMVAMVAGISRVMALELPKRELYRLAFAALVAGVPAVALTLIWHEWWGSVLASMSYALMFVTCTIWLRAWKSKDIAQLAVLLRRYPRLFSGIQNPVERWAASIRRKEEESEQAD